VGKSVHIGPYCIFGNNCSIISSDHNFSSPLVSYGGSGFTVDNEITIGANCWFGINVTVIGNIKVGHGSIIGANTLVNKDIPPFSVVIGNPAKVIKRFDFDLMKWVKGDTIKENSYFEENTYLEYISNNFGSLPLSFHSSSSQFGNI
jgi:acetyltransferase-like isoleucine patch superfamily enzyme